MRASYRNVLLVGLAFGLLVAVSMETVVAIGSGGRFDLSVVNIVASMTCGGLGALFGRWHAMRKVNRRRAY